MYLSATRRRNIVLFFLFCSSFITIGCSSVLSPGANKKQQRSPKSKTSNILILGRNQPFDLLSSIASKKGSFELTISTSISTRETDENENKKPRATVERTQDEQLGKGYSFDFCSSDDECVGDRQCRNFKQLECTQLDGACFCMNFISKEDYKKYNITTDPNQVDDGLLVQLCHTCNECEYFPDESCIKHVDDDDESSNEGQCASVNLVRLGHVVETTCNSFPQVTPHAASVNLRFDEEEGAITYYASSPSPRPSSQTSPPSTAPSENANGVEKETTDNSCIAVHSLTRIHKSNLVFEKHRRANVYCDQHNSCATPGHMVVYNGNAMSMKTYCETVSGECTKEILYVNSPKFSAALRIKSLTENLHFTSFSATYNTKLEEVALRSLIYMGL